MIVILILAPFTYVTYFMVQEFKSKKPEGYQWPSLTDFWLAIVTTIVFNQLEHAFQTVLFPWYYQYCKEKKDEVVRQRRTKKAVNNIYKCFYYSSASLFGWYVLKDSYILPPHLGGNGSLYDMLKDFPYITPPPLYKFYFTATMGYHISQLIHH